MSNCNCPNELTRDGSGRLSRYLPALDPGYAKIDTRSYEDLLVFAQEYAERIRFYDLPESQTETLKSQQNQSWRQFFYQDNALLAASISVLNLENIRKIYTDLTASFEQSPNPELLFSLFSQSIELAKIVDQWSVRATENSQLLNDLNILISSQLSSALFRIFTYEKGYNLLDSKCGSELEMFHYQNDLWNLDRVIPADTSIFKGDQKEEKLLNGALYADEIFSIFFEALSLIVIKSKDYLQLALQKDSSHQPHLTLFFTFLKLFQLAQSQMNELPARMLDFYYRDVLQLKPKPEVADKAIVIFELAKDITEYNLEKGTRLKAGKDAVNKEQIYETLHNLVVNQAQVKELKTIFIEKEIVASYTNEDGTVMPEETILKTFYANPLANTADGLGKEFENETTAQWQTFGAVEPEIETSMICQDLRSMDEEFQSVNLGQLGFGIASPQLVLGGGNRLVILSSEGVSNLIQEWGTRNEGEQENIFEISLTGEKEWLVINEMISENDMFGIYSGNQFTPSADFVSPVYALIGNQGPNENRTDIWIFLPISAPAIVSFQEEVHPGSLYLTKHPVLQLRINPILNLLEHSFLNFDNQNIAIETIVGSINYFKQNSDAKNNILPQDGLKNLILQNDDQVIPLGKPFQPFTNFPSLGKSFYIGSEEVFNKSVQQLSVNITLTSNETYFQVTVNLLKNGLWHLLQTPAGDYFNKNSLASNIIQYQEKDIQSLLNNRLPIQNFSEWTKSNKGFLRLDNFSNFNTSEINLSYAQLSARLVEMEIKEVSLSYSSLLPNLENGTDQFFHVYPFGVAEISIPRYNESQITDAYLKDQDNLTFSNQNLDQILNERNQGIKLRNQIGQHYQLIQTNQLLPQFTFSHSISHILEKNQRQVMEQVAGLGQAAQKVNSNKYRINNNFFRNEKANQYSGDIQEEGILFIGLDKIKPLQNVSLLFQFAEGSALEEDQIPPKINWSYLSNNKWIPLPGEHLLSDGTYGFQTTGIVILTVPKDATDQNTIVTYGLHWLRASVPENANRIPMLIKVIAQAVEAQFIDQENSAQHYDQALAAGSISKMETPVAQISKVIQPFSSYDGKPKEIGREYYARVSERLRHKNRAITALDYEHLILNQFPSIFKVKCITHTDAPCLCRKKPQEEVATGAVPDLCCGAQIAPGHVLLVPIADLKNRNGVNPLQPKVGKRTLIEMVNYLKPLCSPFVNIYAQNPVYEQIIVAFRVQFFTGTDAGFYLKKLNNEIIQFLTPWAFDEKKDVSFGQKVYASSIIDFIEKRSYVDFITDFKMGVCKTECCPKKDKKDENQDGGDILNRIRNCDDVETLLLKVEDEIVVVKPSTQKSILVSASKHRIELYEAPPKPDPCHPADQNRGIKLERATMHQFGNLSPQKDVVVQTNVKPKEGVGDVLKNNKTTVVDVKKDILNSQVKNKEVKIQAKKESLPKQPKEQPITTIPENKLKEEKTAVDEQSLLKGKQEKKPDASPKNKAQSEKAKIKKPKKPE